MKRGIIVLLVVAMLGSGCPSAAPRLTAAQIKDLVWLDDHGYTRDGFDRPKNTAVAVAVDIFPLPGVGHFYLGYIGDGLKLMLLSWLVYPFFMAPIDAFRKSSYINDVAYLDYAHSQGWFDHPEGQGSPPPRVEADRAPTVAVQAPSTSSPAPARAAFCSSCGERFATDDQAFCPKCGNKR
jgi:hypothetical protein